MKQNVLFIGLLLIAQMQVMGQDTTGQESKASWFSSVTEGNRKEITYDVTVVASEIKSSGEKESTLIDWLNGVNEDFSGDYEVLMGWVKDYSQAGSSTFGTAHIEGPSSPMPSDPSSISLLGVDSQNFDKGVWHFGPSYKKGSIVWLVDGQFLFVTNCKAKVRLDYKEDRPPLMEYFPVNLDEVKTVKIVEGEENFRSLIPHLVKWKGKTPTLIYVTTLQGKK